MDQAEGKLPGQCHYISSPSRILTTIALNLVEQIPYADTEQSPPVNHTFKQQSIEKLNK